MKPSPRPTINDLTALLGKAKKDKKKPQAIRLAKVLWLRNRQDARQSLRKPRV